MSNLPIGVRRQYAIDWAQQDAIRLQQAFDRSGVELQFAASEVCSYVVTGG